MTNRHERSGHVTSTSIPVPRRPLPAMNMCLPSRNEIKAVWRLHIRAAKKLWSNLSEAQLIASNGHKLQLVDLILAHHTMSRDEANKQVNNFFEVHMT